MTNLDDYVSQTEAAEILGIDDATVSRWSSDDLKPEARKLTVVRRFGYTKIFRRADVEALRDQLALDKRIEAMRDELAHSQRKAS